MSDLNNNKLLEQSANPIVKNEIVMSMGLTKREYMATMAMQGLFVPCANSSMAEIVRMSVDFSDALIKELSK